MKIRSQLDAASFTSDLFLSSVSSCVDNIAVIANILVSATILPCTSISNLKLITTLSAFTVMFHWSMQNPPQLVMLVSSSSSLCTLLKKDVIYCSSCIFSKSSKPGCLKEVCLIQSFSLTSQHCVTGTSEQHNNQPQLVHKTKGLLWQQAVTEETLPWRPFLIL